MCELTDWFWDDFIETTIAHWSPREVVYFIARLVMVSFGLGFVLAHTLFG